MSRRPNVYVGAHTAEPDMFEIDLEAEAGSEWIEWSIAVGERTLPVLQALARSLPSMTSVMLCTTDGFNLCSLGVEDRQVSGLAALASSLFSVAGAAQESVSATRRAPLEMVTLKGERMHTVVIALEHEKWGALLLVVSAVEVTLGMIVVCARQCGDGISNLIGARS